MSGLNTGITISPWGELLNESLNAYRSMRLAQEHGHWQSEHLKALRAALVRNGVGDPDSDCRNTSEVCDFCGAEDHHLSGCVHFGMDSASRTTVHTALKVR